MRQPIGNNAAGAVSITNQQRVRAADHHVASVVGLLWPWRQT